LDLASSRFFRVSPAKHGAKAIEEVAATYLACLHGELPPRSGDRPWRFLPKHCCRQRQDIDAAALRRCAKEPLFPLRLNEPT